MALSPSLLFHPECNNGTGRKGRGGKKNVKKTITCFMLLFTLTQNEKHDFTADWKNSIEKRRKTKRSIGCSNNFMARNCPHFHQRPAPAALAEHTVPADGCCRGLVFDSCLQHFSLQPRQRVLQTRHLTSLTAPLSWRHILQIFPA